MNPADINYLAVLAAALSTFLIGAIWYSPLLFAKPWMAVNGLTEEALKKGNPAVVFGGAFAFALVISLNLAFFLGKDATVGFGAFAGFAAGFGWVAMSLGTVYLFERRPMKQLLINAGYNVVAYTVMGVILAAWK